MVKAEQDRIVEEKKVNMEPALKLRPASESRNNFKRYTKANQQNIPKGIVN